MSSPFIAPAVASVLVAGLLYVLHQPLATVLLGAGAVFPAVYVLLHQSGLSVTLSSSSSNKQQKSLLEEEEEKQKKREEKKRKKKESLELAAKKKAIEGKNDNISSSAAAVSTSISTSDVDVDTDDGDSQTEEKKSLTKTAQKKAKKAAAAEAKKKAEEAEAEAKRKAEEAAAKKKKKAAKKEGSNNTTTTINDTTNNSNSGVGSGIGLSSGINSTSQSLLSVSANKEEAGWEIQKSDKPSSNKAQHSKNSNKQDNNNNNDRNNNTNKQQNNNNNNQQVASSSSNKSKSLSNKGDSNSSSKSSTSSAISSSSNDTSSNTSSLSNGDNGEVYEEMYIPFKFHGTLIGTKGSTLLQLQSSSGARIDMPKKDSGSTKVQISGTSDAVRSAKGAIESIISKGYSSFTHPGWVHDELAVDEKHYGRIIGSKAEYLNAIQSKTNTKITVPREGSTQEKVLIVGKKEDVKLARQALKDLIKDGYSNLTHEGYIKKELSFPKDKLHLLIGKAGQTIKSIQGNTKTKINIPERSSNSDMVNIIGPEAGIIQAEKEIQRLLIPPEEEPVEEQYINGTWSEAGPTEDELWD